MKEELSLPPRSDTIAILPAVSPGRHELRIEKPGYERIITSFNYSGKYSQVDVGDELIKPLKATK
jgi:hypothetical protein